MRTYKAGTNQFRKRLTPIQYTKALGFVGVWTLALLYCFRVGMEHVVIPQAVRTFDPIAYAPTIEKAYAEPAASNSAVAITPTPYIPTKKDIIFTQKHGDIIYRIYGLESSFGQEPFLYCTRQGKVSDMGYNVLNHQCFDSFTQEVQTVEKWLESHEGMPLGKELCLYNQGNPKISCEYAQNFLSL